MEEMKLAVGEKTAHLFNALRHIEEVNEEVFDAFSRISEEEANARLECFGPQYEYIRDTLKAWIAEAAGTWAVSSPTPPEF